MHIKLPSYLILALAAFAAAAPVPEAEPAPAPQDYGNYGNYGDYGSYVCLSLLNSPLPARLQFLLESCDLHPAKIKATVFKSFTVLSNSSTIPQLQQHHITNAKQGNPPPPRRPRQPLRLIRRLRLLQARGRGGTRASPSSSSRT